MNIFEMHNKFNYFYEKDPSRLSLRLIKHLTCSYSSERETLLFDVFGELGDRKFFELPSYDATAVVDASLARARSLPDIKLMWSGGVDSTFILACYKATGTPVKVYHFDSEENYISPALMKYIRNNYDVTFLKSRDAVVREGRAYLGTLADCFFYSQQRLCGTSRSYKLPLQHGKLIYKTVYCDRPFVPLQDLMSKLRIYRGREHIEDRVFSDYEIDLVLQYAQKMNVLLDTNERIARFLCFTCSLCKQAFGWSGPFYLGIDSFFLTQKFINIAYSQYWDSNAKPWLHDKKMLKDFISDIFGSDFGVEKNYF